MDLAMPGLAWSIAFALAGLVSSGWSIYEGCEALKFSVLVESKSEASKTATKVALTFHQI